MNGTDITPGLAVMEVFFLVFWLAYLALLVVMFWSYGTLLKAALGESKVMVLLMLVPIVNLVMPIVWGLRAHKLLLEREGKIS